MLEPLAHVAAALRFAARRAPQERDDRAAVAEAAWSVDDLPAGVTLTWLGTSGFRLGYAGHELLIDPYLTRVPFRALLRPATPRYDAIAAQVPRASAILIGHTHFDHAMDAPVIAAALGCPVYGSASLARLMDLHGAAAHAVEVTAHQVYELGPFRFRFVPSKHSKLALGLWTPADGELACEHLDELTPQRYRCGQVWGIHVEVAGATFYHQGSCDLIDDEIPRQEVDYLLAGIAGRRFTPRYLQRLLARLSPRVIVPHHWDDFFRPLDAPTGLSLNVNVAGFLDEVRAVSTDFEIRTLEPMKTV